MTDTLQKFKEYLEELGYYEHVVNQLQWDLQTQTPKKGYDNKVEVMTHFSTEAFNFSSTMMRISSSFFSLLVRSCSRLFSLLVRMRSRSFSLLSRI